jgi:hypothetical protein
MARGQGAGGKTVVLKQINWMVYCLEVPYGVYRVKKMGKNKTKTVPRYPLSPEGAPSSPFPVPSFNNEYLFSVDALLSHHLY